MQNEETVSFDVPVQIAEVGVVYLKLCKQLRESVGNLYVVIQSCCC